MEILKKDENGNYIASKEKILQALALKDFNGLSYFAERTIKEYLDYIYIYDMANSEKDEKNIRIIIGKILTGGKDLKTDSRENFLDSLANQEVKILSPLKQKLVEGYLERAYTNFLTPLNLEDKKNRLLTSIST